MIQRLPALIVIFLLFTNILMAQGRAELLKTHASKLQYPLFKVSPLTGVFPIQVTTPYSNKGKVKLAFDFGESSSDPAKPSEGLEEVMRIMNLHVAAGIKPGNIEAVVIVHGPGAGSFLENGEYNERFKGDNPNLPLIKEMQAKGMKFVVCGQTMGMRGFQLNAFAEGMGSVFSARTHLSDLDSHGYMIFPVITR